MILHFQLQPHVVITKRQVFETRRETSAGIDVIRHRPPIDSYWIDYIDEDGFACSVWDGDTYANALIQARSWAAAGVAVRDRVSRGWRA